ncbi:MAG TPA: hypothetical protein VNW54_11845 [Granulicella sp.]|jgi:hypothetical protein|nr:hypothetical protein [Granulicella sp.]
MKIVSKSHLAAVFALTTLTAFAAGANPVTLNGWVSDSQCGNAHGKGGPNPSCVAKCIGKGAKPVFVDDAKNEVWTIDDPDAVKAHYGHHIAATASVDPDTKVLHITKVTMLADQGKATGMDMH